MRNRRVLLWIYLFFVTGFLFAQKPQQTPVEIENLVFEGAGIRGLAYVGAAAALEEKGLMKKVKNVGGTSAGAITALMISLGYSGDEALQVILETRYHKFNKGCCFFIGGLVRLNRNFGWYRNKNFIHYLEDLVRKKAGTADVRFKDLDSLGFKNLAVTGTCLTHQKTLVFSKETFPEMRIVDAVAISMTIPLYFSAMLMDDRGGIHRHARDKDSLHVMVDGGVLANYPIHLFDHQDQAKLSNGHYYNPHTLGFRIDSRAQIRQDSISNHTLAPRKIRKVSDFIGALYNVTSEMLNRYPLTPEDWRRTVSISSMGIGPKIRKMSEEEKMILYNSGKRSATMYLNKHGY